MRESPARRLLVNETNLAANDYYYPSPGGAELEKGCVLAFGIKAIGGVTVTIEAAMGEKRTDGTDPDWVDITNAFLDLNTGLNVSTSVGDASTDRTTIIQLNGADVDKYRVKVTTADATNTVKIHERVL